MLRDVLSQKGLSNRETEVAELVTKGLSNKEVASQLFVTEKTVKFHLTNIYKKMNVKSRAQLIVWCMPHMSFIDERAEAQPQQPQAQAQPINNTIPTGSAPVGNIPFNKPFGGNDGNGNTGSSGSNDPSPFGR
jgi:LuxR family transcriptional regulator, positive regulator of biofilm formation